VPYDINAPGLKQTGGSARFVRSTIAGNTVGIAATGSVTLHATVVADNLTDCSAPVVSEGYNLDEDGTCLTAPATGDLPSTAAALGAFTAPGVVVPPAGSALLDQIPAGTPYLCDGQHPVDQRGLARPAGAACDIGAIERQPTDP
jgi:hypothetical protein